MSTSRRESVIYAIKRTRERIDSRVIELKDTLNQTRRDNLTEELRDWMRDLKNLTNELVPELTD